MDKKTFEAVLLSDDFYQFWHDKTKAEVEILLGKAAAAMVGFEQCNPHHCYTLFEHALHTVQNLHRKINCADTHSRYLLAAAFFHDLGKVDTARKKDGRLVFYGHAAHSVKLARPVLYKMGYTHAEADMICFYIKHHDDFISFRPMQQGEQMIGYIAINKVNVRSVISKAESGHYDKEMWLHLLLLCCADAEAQSEKVYKNNVLTDSKQAKVERLQAIFKIIADEQDLRQHDVKQ